ncbi:AraC family transcriptional regulator [Litchfieldia alkalitelluris]|uniref:AraC family transcriptional regulator n=1 Tax=Litchfieldia alkalitelluris TaxID=304268 RepID=UPI000996BE8F|nr:AraC family transcriptional regulator [Litchfieldia alkalitelluris]
MTKPGKIAKSLNQLTFSLLLAGHKHCPQDWYKAEKIHKYHSIWLITKGQGEIIINGNKHKVKPGKLIIYSPGMVCEKKGSPTDPLEFYFIRFSYAVAYEEKETWYLEQGQETDFPLKGIYSISNISGITLLFEQITNLSKRRGPSVAIQRKILFQELWLTIIEDFRSQKIAGDTTLAIELTIDYMVNHYNNSLTLTDLSTMAGLSSSHYSRLFKKYVGYSPIDYLTHLRIDRAKELLALSDFRIKEISQSVGYEDELYFSRIFKKIVGMSPSQFNMNHKTVSDKKIR